MAEITDPPLQAPKKKKKTLAFLRNTPKPAPAHSDDLDKNKEVEDEDDDGLDMFKRSKDFFPTIIKKQESEAREATPEPHVESKKHAPGDSDEDLVPSSSRSSKRRRTSSPEPHPWRVESFDELYGPATPPRRSSKSPTPASRRSNRKQSTPASIKRIKDTDSPITSGEGKDEENIDLVQSDLLPTPTSRSNSHQLSTEVIPLASDDEDEPAIATWTNHTPSPAKPKEETRPAEGNSAASNAIVVDDSDDDDLSAAASEPKDDEFAHFVAAARRKQEAAAAAAAALAPPGDSSDNEQDSLTANAAGARTKKSAPYEVVKIFVHSRIAAFAEYDPQGFGCQRKINQSVGPVRDAFPQWLRRKGVPVTDEMDKAIFLTWKGRRIYNSVSGLGLGWQPQGTNKPHEREPGFIRDGVLLEAWTEEDFERYTADLERQRLIDRGELVEEGPGVEVADDPEEQAEPEVAKVKVILKEKNTEPVRMTTFLDTQVRVLIGAYRRQKKVAEDREIRLNYDGDWLNPEMTVAQAYIDDMCTVEVYIK